MAGIYIHIPFCKQACTYCNFHFSTSLKMKDDMLHGILKELDMQRHYLPEQAQIETIYFGGGTPSLLRADEINRIADFIYEHYPVQQIKEFTLETNPDDLNNQYVHSLRNTPVNRFSIGVQSFRENDLKYMNRAHNAQQADYAIKAAQDAGFTNITIDLIYGTPGLTDEDWLYNLAQVKSLRIPHFSSYALTVEEGTALARNIQKKKSVPVDAEQAAGQFEILMEKAEEMGFDHYEISNLALPGHYAVHNTNYWRGLPYLGIGPSAHSFDGRNRRWNLANNALYLKSILTENRIPFEEEVLTQQEQLNEYIMTSQRTMWGTDLKKIETEFGSDALKHVIENSQVFIEKGWQVLEENKLLLTKAGKLFADRIASDLFIV